MLQFKMYNLYKELVVIEGTMVVEKYFPINQQLYQLGSNDFEVSKHKITEMVSERGLKACFEITPKIP